MQEIVLNKNSLPAAYCLRAVNYTGSELDAV